MTAPSTSDHDNAADDQTPAEFRYDHGRMPLFMKFVWLAFLVFAAWYTVVYLLDSVGRELS